MFLSTSSDPAGSAGASGAKRYAGGRVHTSGPVRGRLGGGVRVLGLDSIGPLQLQGTQLLVDAVQLRLTGVWEVVGIADEPHHVCPVVVAKGAELARHRHHRVGRVHGRLDEGDQWDPSHPSGTPRPRRPSASQGGRCTISSGPSTAMGSLSWDRMTARSRARASSDNPWNCSWRSNTPTVPCGTSVLLPRAMPLRDHFASQGSPTHRARSMP